MKQKIIIYSNLKYNILKIKLLFFIIYIIIILNKKYPIYNLNEYYLDIQRKLNLTFYKKIKYKIKIGLYSIALKNGGRSRITSILINHLSKIKIFKIFSFTQRCRESDEYEIPENTKRIIIKNNLIQIIKIYKINILIYQLTDIDEITKLNNLKKIKIIYYPHCSFFFWLYLNYANFKYIYKAFRKSKYIISLVPLENYYLFKKWKINSILMDTFITYEYNKVIPSSLSSKTILMIGRGEDRLKRFELGIEAMKYIIKEIPECKMNFISDLKGISYLQDLVKKLNLEKNVNFLGYTLTPEIYFKNASLHIFPSISESFGLVLCETKIYGIPTILLGLDYVSISRGGTIIIYDDNPIQISIEAIKILNNDTYRKKLGKEAKKSMKKFNNELLVKKWIKLILSVYNGDYYYNSLKKEDEKIHKNELFKMLKNQIILLKKRKPNFENINTNNIINFSYLEQLE